jgi:hypothetical protein
MMLNQQTKYPSRRVYVLKVRSDAKPDALAGRLENIVTGRQLEFASSEELLDSIAHDLKAAANEPSIRPEGA